MRSTAAYYQGARKNNNTFSVIVSLELVVYFRFIFYLSNLEFIHRSSFHCIFVLDLCTHPPREILIMQLRKIRQKVG